MVTAKKTRKKAPAESAAAPRVPPELLARCRAISKRLDVPLVELLAALLRNVIVASPGHKLVAADFASIEARVVAWLAGEQWLLDAFSAYDAGEGENVYCVFGSRHVFKRPITKKGDVNEYDISKRAVLGCLAEGTPVLTEVGWQRIEQVKPGLRVWDGLKWVHQEGAVFKGVKPCINVAGVWMTPDHKVLTDAGWVEAEHLVNVQRPLSGSASADGRWRIMNWDRATAWLPSSVAAIAARAVLSTNTTSGAASRHSATPAPGTSSWRDVSRPAVTLPSSLTTTFANGGWIASRRAFHAVTAPARHVTPVMVGEASLSTNRGEQIAGLFSHISPRSQASINLKWSWIASTTTAGTSPGTCGSRPAPSSAGIRDVTSSWSGKVKLCARPTSTQGFAHATGVRRPCCANCAQVSHLLKSSPNKTTAEVRTARVYDLLDAGPDHRFQAGGLIVHNCGYGLGPQRFAVTVAKERAVFPPGLTATMAVEAWRDAHPKIAGEPTGNTWVDKHTGEPRKARRGGLWKDLGSAMLEATRNPHYDRQHGRLRFQRDGADVRLYLPSGRFLLYQSPRIVLATREFDGREIEVEQVEIQTYKGPARIYGGLLAENATQATAYDLMALAAEDADAAGHALLLTVHDELLFEAPDDAVPALIDWCHARLPRAPEWADGLPLNAEVNSMERYAK